MSFVLLDLVTIVRRSMINPDLKVMEMTVTLNLLPYLTKTILHPTIRHLHVSVHTRAVQ